jgi:hypothetical protein
MLLARNADCNPSTRYSYVQVYKGLLDGIHEVAIKLFTDTSDSTQVKRFLQEVELLKHCRNSQIVQVLLIRLLKVLPLACHQSLFLTGQLVKPLIATV